MCIQFFAAGLLSHWVHRRNALPVAQMSGQAGTPSGGKSKGCDLQIYIKLDRPMGVRRNDINPTQSNQYLRNSFREDAMNFEGQNISLTDALFVDHITGDLETFRLNLLTSRHLEF